MPFGVRPGAAGGLAYAGVQVQVLALGVAPPPMHSPRYNPLRRGSVLPLGVEAHLKIKVTPDL